MGAPTPQAAVPWSPIQIHDSVAAIVRQPAFAGSGRESLLGRFLRYVIAGIRDVLDQYRGSPSARYMVIAGLVVLILIVVARDIDAKARRRGVTVRGSSIDANLWGAAQEFAARGDFTAASHALYAA